MAEHPAIVLSPGDTVSIHIMNRNADNKPQLRDSISIEFHKAGQEAPAMVEVQHFPDPDHVNLTYVFTPEVE